MAGGTVSIMDSELPERERMWLLRMQAWERSGQSGRVFATEAGVTLSALRYWRGVLIGKGLFSPAKDASPLFQKVSITPPQLVAGCRLRLRNGVVMEVDGGLDGEGLARLLVVAGQLP